MGNGNNGDLTVYSSREKKEGGREELEDAEVIGILELVRLLNCMGGRPRREKEGQELEERSGDGGVVQTGSR